MTNTFPVWVSAQTPRGPRTVIRADQITSIRVRDETGPDPRYVLEAHSPQGWTHLAVGTTDGFRDHAATWLADKITATSVPPTDPFEHVGVRMMVVGESRAPSGNLSFVIETSLIGPYDPTGLSHLSLTPRETPRSP